MQLTFDSDVEEFRAEFAAFLDEHLPSEALTPGAADGRCRICRSGRATGSGCCSTTAGCCPHNRRSSAAATRRCCSSSCTSTSCADAGSTTASIRRA